MRSVAAFAVYLVGCQSGCVSRHNDGHGNSSAFSLRLS
jgi:hypothetical protein